jgi:hypothetical protein
MTNIGYTNQSQPTKHNRVMIQKWEYLNVTDVKHPTVEWLNIMGSQGWEMCAWSPGTMVFKRHPQPVLSDLEKEEIISNTKKASN